MLTIKCGETFEMIKIFKTPKGTELPFLNLEGKDYLQVQHRLVWFREERPDYVIKSSLIEHGDAYAIFQSTILDTNLNPVSQAHGREDAKHFVDYIEKAETKAIGRALALFGYGTQFAPELDEHDRIVDAPAKRDFRASYAHDQGGMTNGARNDSPVTNAAPEVKQLSSPKPSVNTLGEGKTTQASPVPPPLHISMSGPEILSGPKPAYSAAASNAFSQAFRDHPLPEGVKEGSPKIRMRPPHEVQPPHIVSTEFLQEMANFCDQNGYPKSRVNEITTTKFFKNHPSYLSVGQAKELFEMLKEEVLERTKKAPPAIKPAPKPAARRTPAP